MRILAVCAGNICRSPAAEAAIREAATAAGVDVETDSAGTGSWHIGQPPHPESVAAGDRAGLNVVGRARKVTAADFDRFDIILAMDRANLRDLDELAPSREAQARTRLFRTYDPAATSDEVPDPWGGPEASYDETIRIVRAAAIGLVAEMLEHSRL
ncbi:MAG TPA: low molecular weight protein-tyrosine-phosphatase [Acidimicrobiia bacterium]|nr:low molecular weight protein-tyrosine-phosphatase [Acidimicrobiia bacterium]